MSADKNIHPLLARQLRKSGLADPFTPPSPEAWGKAIERISASYVQAEQDRYLLERSLDLSSREMQELTAKLASERDRLDQDLHKVITIQRAIHPQARSVPGLEWAVRSEALEAISGDYFDVQVTDTGCWIGIGDVAGHGLTAGMLAIMLQSVVAAIIKRSPHTSPAELVTTVNAVMFENVRARLALDDHATLTVLRYEPEGAFLYAGAHEEIVVCRAQDGACETFSTPGTWTALTASVERYTVNSRFEVRAGDVVLLHSDGVTEAQNGDGEQYGLPRLCATLAEVRARPVEEIADRLWEGVRAFRGRPRDDATLAVLRAA